MPWWAWLITVVVVWVVVLMTILIAYAMRQQKKVAKQIDKDFDRMNKPYHSRWN